MRTIFVLFGLQDSKIKHVRFSIPRHGVCRQPKGHQWPQKSLFRRRTKWIELIKNWDAIPYTITRMGLKQPRMVCFHVFPAKNLGLIMLGDHQANFWNCVDWSWLSMIEHDSACSTNQEYQPPVVGVLSHWLTWTMVIMVKIETMRGQIWSSLRW